MILKHPYFEHVLVYVEEYTNCASINNLVARPIPSKNVFDSASVATLVSNIQRWGMETQNTMSQITAARINWAFPVVAP